MKLALALILFASGAGAAEPIALSPTAALSPTTAAAPAPDASSGSAAPEPVSRMAQVLGHAGFLYSFSLSTWSVFNGNPLAYTPFEIGYDFGNGLRLQTGYDIFYYNGVDTDDRHPESGKQDYTYTSMSDWRSTVFYRVPMPTRLRPLLGLSVNFVGGQRKLAPHINDVGLDDNLNAQSFPAWGYVGLGAQFGLEYLLSADWSVQLSGRYDFTFSALPSPTVAQLGLTVTF